MPNRKDHRSIGFVRALAIAACAMLAAPALAGPYLLVDAQSGRVIAQSDAGKPWHPASVTKLMTTYLAFRAMRDGVIEANTLFEVSDRAVAQPPSKMGFKAGTQITVDNAIKMLMVRSANDIAVVIAEGLSGTVDAFVEKMNRTAAELGMDGTHFANPHGLPDDSQVTTARDMAILARTIMREFPEYELYFRIPAIQIGKRIIRNHNRLIDRYPGADGMKTGFICASGFNVVAGATRNGKRLIAVVFGSYSAAQRAEDAAKLFERGFNRDTTLATLFDSETGNVEAIRNAGGTAADLREQMCNPKRKRPAAESDVDDDDDEVAAADSKSGAKDKAKQTKSASLLGPLVQSMPPIRVFTGLPSKTPEGNIAARPDKDEKPVKAAPAKPDKPAAKTEKKAPTKTEKAAPAKAEKTAAPVKDQSKNTQTAGTGSASAAKKTGVSGAVTGAPAAGAGKVTPAAPKQ
ncbi:MAG: serine hydrolase [Bradyrhizobiaceae bacterium]|nr:serine hydrolase [Bradyrhizobiaceae bacterium]